MATNQKRTPPCFGLPRLVQPSGDLGDDLASAPAAKQLSDVAVARLLESFQTGSDPSLRDVA
jgi:hypothetical protein